jgi:hypothetical protein
VSLRTRLNLWHPQERKLYSHPQTGLWPPATNGKAQPQPLYPTMAPRTKLPDMWPGKKPDAGAPTIGTDL